jgi:hypothetical protein
MPLNSVFILSLGILRIQFCYMWLMDLSDIFIMKNTQYFKEYTMLFVFSLWVNPDSSGNYIWENKKQRKLLDVIA